MRLATCVIVAALLAPAVSSIACGVSCLQLLTERSVRTASCHEDATPAGAVSAATAAGCHQDAESSLTAVATPLRVEAIPAGAVVTTSASFQTSNAAIAAAPVRPPPGPQLHAPPLRI